MAKHPAEPDRPGPHPDHDLPGHGPGDTPGRPDHDLPGKPDRPGGPHPDHDLPKPGAPPTAQPKGKRAAARDASTPATSLTSLLPISAAIGDPSFMLRVVGSGFDASSVIVFAGQDEPTNYVSDTELTTGVDMSVWLGPDPAIPVLVRTTLEDGTEEETNALDFAFTEARAVPLPEAHASQPIPAMDLIQIARSRVRDHRLLDPLDPLDDDTSHDDDSTGHHHTRTEEAADGFLLASCEGSPQLLAFTREESGAMGAFESGQSFVAGVLAKLPAELQAQAKAVFDAAEAKDAVTLIGDGALARSDYSRHMDTLREKETSLTEYYTKLDGWYKDNEAALKAARGAAPGNGNGNGHVDDPLKPAAPLQSPSLTAAEIRKIADEAVNEAGKDYIAVSAFLATQGGWHSHVFGEPLDMTELVNNPKLGRPILGQPGRVYSLQDAYHEKYGERIAAKNKEAEDKRIDAEVEKRIADRSRTSAGQPFPLRSESSPLDVLSTKDGPAAHTLDSAVAEYERLVAAKST